MLRKIGKFEAYIPDRNLFDTFLKILSLTDFEQNEKFDSTLHLLYRFFLKFKGKYPHVFEDVFFNHDPDFPYSEQVEDCLTRLQESGFITRPNPSLNQYRIDVDLSDSRPDPSSPDFETLQQMAKDFEKEFRIKDGPSCRI